MTAPVSTKATYGALLSTITNTAQAASAIINSATKSAGMLDSFVTEAATRQEHNNRINRIDHIATLINEKASARATANMAIEEFRSKSELHAKHFDEAHSQYTALFAKELGITT